MSKFKIGDEVISKTTGRKHIVRDIQGHDIVIEGGGGFTYSQDKFVFADPILEAKAVLEQAGYAVIPPAIKPKVARWVNLFQTNNNSSFWVCNHETREEADAYAASQGHRDIRIACVMVTEGDGLLS